MAQLDPAAFDSRINFSPLLQALQGYRQGMDANHDFRTNQNIGTKIAARDWGGAEQAAAAGGAELPTLLALGERARAEQERARQAEALRNPALMQGISPAYAAAIKAMSPEQQASQFAQAQSPMTAAQLASARASAAHASGAESRAQAMHPLDIRAKQEALDAAKIGTVDPDKQMYQRMPDGSVKWIEPPQGAGPSKQTLDTEDKLRKEYSGQQQVKEYQTVRNAFQNVQNAAKDPSAAGDLSMIFAYMKILDPNSVVREQEFANAQNAAGVPDRIRNVYNRIMEGERLNPAQRKDFLTQADKLHGSSLRQYEAVRSQIGQIAKGARARPEQVTIDYGAVPDPKAPAPNPTGQGISGLRQTPQQAAPQPGAIVDHPTGKYRFKGGAPNDPSAWEKVQ